MDHFKKQYGYDAVFMSETPDYLHCVECSMVLRDPVQIDRCGHRFCFGCFLQLKDNAVKMRTELCCPVDQDLIDIDKVSEDHSIHHRIRNLLVKCSSWEHGCKWQGELSDLERHERDCGFGLQGVTPLSAAEISDVLGIVNILQERMKVYELLVDQKEKENSILKENLSVIRKQWDEKSREMMNDINLLKNFSSKIETQLNSTSERNSLLEIEVGILKQKNAVLEKNYEVKMNSIEQDIHSLKKQQSDKDQLRAKNSQPAFDTKTGNCCQKDEFHGHPSKRTTLCHFKCDPGDVTLSPDNQVQFHDWSTVVASCSGVPVGCKGYYEVTYKVGSGTCRVGWVNEKYLTSEESQLVGNCSNSYGFNGHQLQYKRHNNLQSKWGMKIASDGGAVVGVAIDLIKGEILYGVDGNWNAPMGAAFHCVSSDSSYFPAITGCCMKVDVNLGQKKFQYLPPDGF